MTATPTEFRAYLVCSVIKAKYHIHIVYFLFQFWVYTTYMPPVMTLMLCRKLVCKLLNMLKFKINQAKFMLTWDKFEATTHAVCVGGHRNANEKWNELQDVAQPRVGCGSPLPGHKQIIRCCFVAKNSCFRYDLVWFDFDFDFRLINETSARDL